ncbi:MAG TPA: hypothetical protein VNH46_05575 [Gemmatimonadales bacterium]|nr:hypothetical protein [Gemmatimonadales bacterium]
MRRALVVSLSFLSSALAAQQPSLVGTWQVSYPGGARIENGAVTVLRATGVLTIEAQDDSLIATLVQDPAPDLPARPPARLAAARTAGPATFISRSTAKINMNGDEQDATAVSTWVLQATGDSLSGTVARRIEGFDMATQPPNPVTGTRRKG